MSKYKITGIIYIHIGMNESNETLYMRTTVFVELIQNTSFREPATNTSASLIPPNKRRKSMRLRGM